ncbi:MAG: hypothetical protein ACI92B_002717 [Marinobacter maritimus]
MVFRYQFVYAALDNSQRFINRCHESFIPNRFHTMNSYRLQQKKSVSYLAPCYSINAQFLNKTCCLGWRIISMAPRKIRRAAQQP